MPQDYAVCEAAERRLLPVSHSPGFLAVGHRLGFVCTGCAYNDSPPACVDVKSAAAAVRPVDIGRAPT